MLKKMQNQWNYLFFSALSGAWPNFSAYLKATIVNGDYPKNKKIYTIEYSISDIFDY